MGGGGVYVSMGVCVWLKKRCGARAVVDDVDRLYRLLTSGKQSVGTTGTARAVVSDVTNC